MWAHRALASIDHDSTSSCESACHGPNNWWAWLLLYTARTSLSMRTWAPCMKMVFYFKASLRKWRESLVMMSEAMVNLLEHGPARYEMDWIYIHTEVRYWSRAELSSLTKNLRISGSFWHPWFWLIRSTFLGLLGWISAENHKYGVY